MKAFLSNKGLFTNIENRKDFFFKVIFDFSFNSEKTFWILKSLFPINVSEHYLLKRNFYIKTALVEVLSASKCQLRPE